MTTTRNRLDSARLHRRETILYLIVPMIGAGVMVLAGGVIVLLLPKRAQVSLISDWMLSLFMLLPCLLCLFGICMVFILAVAGMNKAHSLATRPLDRLEDFSATLTDQAVKASNTVKETAATLGTKLEPVERALSVFDEPPASENGEEKHV